MNHNEDLRIKTIIVDDEEPSRNVLRKLLQGNCPNVEIVGETDHGAGAIKLIREVKPHLVLLDIEMPGGDGFAVLDQLRSEIDFHVIFVTAYDNYALRAIKYAALDFILKPIRTEDLVRAIDVSTDRIYHDQQFKVLDEYYRNTQQSGRIILAGNTSQIVVDLSDISKVKAQNNYVLFTLVNGSSFLASHNLQYYEDLLPEGSFYRIHRSCIVNLNHVKRYDKGSGGFVYLEDGSAEAVATRRKPDFVKQLRNH